jgi:hypothetical protein
MRYTGLGPNARYKVRVVYSDLDPNAKVRLEAGHGFEVHPLIYRRTPSFR